MFILVSLPGVESMVDLLGQHGELPGDLASPFSSPSSYVLHNSVIGPLLGGVSTASIQYCALVLNIMRVGLH